MLDPSRIESDDCPINLQRLLDFCRSKHPFKNGGKTLKPK